MSLRIMYSANAVWAVTGYGIQGKSLLPRLKALGHECANFAWYGLQGGTMVADGIPIYPAVADQFGNDIIGGHVKHFNADLVVSLMDIWVLPDNYAELVRPAKWLPWTPVDHDPVPPIVARKLKTADYPCTYSNFGWEQALAAGVTNARYIPHGVEVNIFKPGDKRAARQTLGLPDDAYVCSMVAANKGQPPRKAFGENLQAFAAFQRMHPEAILYLHTLAGTQHQGVNFDALIAACGIPREAIRFVDQYAYSIGGLPQDYLANVYRASDVLLAASQNEGFGIPIIEAQSCGCPVITTDFTSMTEITINGIATQPAQRFWSPLDSWVATPDVGAITEALEAIYGWPIYERTERMVDGVRHMRANYDWDVLVRDWWQPLLLQIEQDIRGVPVEMPQEVTTDAG